MELPQELAAAADDDRGITVHERDDDRENVLTVDFGPAAGDLSVDTVGNTAIVVTGTDQFEFEIPDDVDEVTSNDGMLILRRRN